MSTVNMLQDADEARATAETQLADALEVVRAADEFVTRIFMGGSCHDELESYQKALAAYITKHGKP